MAFIILMLAGIAVGMTQIRGAELSTRYEIQKLQTQRVELRRQLWDLQVRKEKLLAPEQLRRRIEELGLPLVEKGKLEETLARSAASPGQPAANMQTDRRPAP